MMDFFDMSRNSCFLLTCGSLVGCDSDSPTSLREQLVYVALGASDAFGVGAIPLNNGYVYKIRDGLRSYAEQVDLYNLGVSGVHINYVEETELPTAISRYPDIVTLWPGPNDVIRGTAVEVFERSLNNILQQLRQQTEAVIVLANIPDMTQVPRFLIDPDKDVTIQRIVAYNDAIRRQAVTFQCPVVDLFEGGYATDWEYVWVDGFHPSNKGHAKLAELYLAEIRNYL
jgi:acyl-CoA thioesterase-1